MKLDIERIKETVAYKTRALLYDPEMWDAFEWNEVLEDANRELQGHGDSKSDQKTFTPPPFTGFAE